MPVEVPWHEKYEKHILAHYSDGLQIERICQQLHKLIAVYAHLKADITKNSPKYMKRMRALNNLRQQINKHLKRGSTLTPGKKAELMKLRMRLPASTLLDRIRFMELSELHGPRQTEVFMSDWRPKDLQPLVGKCQAHERSLKRLHAATLMVISDLHDIVAAINFVERKLVSKYQIRP
ncbi:hypothetical protein KR222_010893, partial [Zaprionus bogoriensis]